MTTTDRMTKQPPQDRRERAKPKAEHEPSRTEPQRKPEASEALEWRGAGVCGDRQTD